MNILDSRARRVVQLLWAVGTGARTRRQWACYDRQVIGGNQPNLELVLISHDLLHEDCVARQVRSELPDGKAR